MERNGATAAEGDREEGDGEKGGAGGLRDTGDAEGIEAESVDLIGIGADGTPGGGGEGGSAAGEGAIDGVAAIGDGGIEDGGGAEDVDGVIGDAAHGGFDTESVNETAGPCGCGRGALGEPDDIALGGVEVHGAALGVGGDSREALVDDEFDGPSVLVADGGGEGVVAEVLGA